MKFYKGNVALITRLMLKFFILLTCALETVLTW